MRLYGLKLPNTRINFKLNNSGGGGGGGGENLTPAEFNILGIIGRSDITRINTLENAPSDIFFTPDGTKMFFCGFGTARLRVMELREPYEIDSGYIVNSTFLFSSQDSSPQAIFFKPDGTKLYMIGDINDRIYQYSLSTPWNITTISYDSVFVSVSSYETVVRGLFISPDGTRIYLCGQSSSSIIRYDMSTPWNLATASYHSTLNVSSFDAYPIGVDFKSDGTKMYVMGFYSKKIREYTLSTPWNLSTATYTTGQEYNVNNIDVWPHDVRLTDSGNLAYFPGESNDNINRISLTTAYDIKTASMEHLSHIILDNFVPSKARISGVGFKPDGKIMYLSTDDGYFQFNLEVPWRLSTVSYASKTLNVSLQDVWMKNMYFNSTGSIMLTVGSNNKRVYRYNLSTPWDISTATYSGSFFNLGTHIPGTIYSFAVRSDGTKIFATGGQLVYSFSLSSAWDLSTMSYDGVSYNATDVGTTITGIFMNNDGTKMYLLRHGLSSNNNIFEYSLSSAWNLSSVTFIRGASFKGLTHFGSFEFPTNMFWGDSGKRLYVAGDSTKVLLELSTQMPNESFSVIAQDNQITDVNFNNDGTIMYILGDQNNRIYQYSLSTPWNISTATYASKFFDFSSQDTSPLGIFFNSDGTKLYMVGDQNNRVYQYSLSTPWDVSTISYDSVFLNVGSQDATPSKIVFRPNGTRLYVLGKTSNTIYQYNLSTAWNLSTASYSSKSFSVSFAPDPTGFFIASDGRSGVVFSNTNNGIFTFDINNAWELDSVFYTYEKRIVLTQGFNMLGLFFRPNGKQAFICNRTNNTVISLKSNLSWSPRSFGALF